MLLKLHVCQIAGTTLQMLRVYLVSRLSLASRATENATRVAHLPWANVLMLNPNVGLTLIMSSPLSFFRIVVLPALSKPLSKERRRIYQNCQLFQVKTSSSLQEKYSHLLLLLAVLSDDGVKSHVH